jgi:ERCC4-type nuclease
LNARKFDPEETGLPGKKKPGAVTSRQPGKRRMTSISHDAPTASRKRPAIPAELRPEDVVAIVDSREQLPWDLSPLQMEAGALYAGDYAPRGLETKVAIERKSLPDFLACCGVERPRFEREIIRLRGYDVRAVVIESDWGEIERGDWRSQIQPAAVIGSILSWTADEVPILLAGNRERAAKLVARLLYLAARNRWRESRALVGGILEPAQSTEAAAAGVCNV